MYAIQDVAQLVDFIAQALEYVHQQGEIHRQVSLSKIILSASGRPRLAGPSPVIAMPVPPPECVRDGEQVELTAAVDSWGLGIVAYTLLVGKPPFMASEDTADPDMVCLSGQLPRSFAYTLCRSSSRSRPLAQTATRMPKTLSKRLKSLCCVTSCRLTDLPLATP